MYISCSGQPVETRKIPANNSIDKRINDIKIHIEGEENGGAIEIKRDSKKNSTKLNLQSGETQVRKYTVVAKGGVLKDIKMKFIGK